MVNVLERKEIVIVLDSRDRPTGLESNLPSDSTNISSLSESKEGEEAKNRANDTDQLKQEANHYSDANIANPFEDPQYEYSTDDSDSSTSCNSDFMAIAWAQPTMTPRKYLSQDEYAICMKMWHIVDRLEVKARSTPAFFNSDLFNAWRRFEGAMLGIPKDQIVEYVPLGPDSRNCDACEDGPTERLLGSVQMSTPENVGLSDIPSDFAQTVAEMSGLHFI